MSPLWRNSVRIGLCPGRLVTPEAVLPVDGDPVTALKQHAGKRKVSVVLSNYLVRYALLPWSANLRSDADWAAYGQHVFGSTYGASAAGWEIRVSSAGRGKARVASAIDASLWESLRALGCVASIQPYVMAAFNGRRQTLEAGSAWFVVHEPGRLGLCLVASGAWKLVRCRAVQGDWHEALPDLLDREAAASAEPQCDEVFVHAETESPVQLGRYRVRDVTLPRGVALEARSRAMVLH